jgi:hypothetical protein
MTVEQLRQDLVRVLDEHGVEYTSFTITETKKRRHGQIQFEEILDGDKQERMTMSTEKV